MSLIFAATRSGGSPCMRYPSQDRQSAISPPATLLRRTPSGAGGGGGPGIQRGRFRSLDVIDIQLGDEREIETRPLARAREPADIGPLGFHALVLDIAQPPAEHRQPISEAHQRVPPCSSRKSTRRAKGSNPTTRGASATKLDKALMS